MAKKTLIVSTDKSLFDFLTEGAWREELNAEYAENPLQALDVIEQNEITMVFIDVCCYGNRANELSQEIKKRISATVIAYVSEEGIMHSIIDFDYVFSKKEDALEIITKIGR